MVNDSKLQQMYLMILFGLSIAQLNFFMTLLLLNQEYLQETGNQEETAISKNQNCAKSCSVKKGRTNAWWENFIANKVPESEWKDNF